MLLLSNICSILNALGNVDDGVESLLTKEALSKLLNLISALYGDGASAFVEGYFIERDDGVVCLEDAGDEFRNYIKGRSE